MEENLILYGGRIYAHPRARPVEAAWIANGRIREIGAASSILESAPTGTRRLDLDGGTVTAGFTDSHVHLTSWALARERLSLSRVRTVDEAVARVAAAPAREGWLRGGGWTLAALDRRPSAADLDAVAADRPVLLESQDLHAAWLNSAGLLACGIDRHTPDPRGGSIERDPVTGEPTGLLLENARAMALSRLPSPSRGEITDALLGAQSEAHRLGITGVHSVEVDGITDFLELEYSDRLRLRVLQHIQLGALESAIQDGLRGGEGSDWMRVGGVKIFLDGSLGSRTAWLREPYVGAADDRGVRMMEADELEAVARRASGAGFSCAVHAIGDAAVALAIGVLSRVPPAPPLPHRIEHVQLCPPDLWSAAGSSGIVGSVQPSHLLTDRAPAERLWGPERSRGAYAFGALRRAGMVLAFGSDVPVETLDPRPALYAATLRGDWRGFETGLPVEAWFSEHRLDGVEAVSAYTEGPAHAAGQSASRGRLMPGYDADLVVWSVDPIQADPSEYRGMKCLLAMVGGEVVFEELS